MPSTTWTARGKEMKRYESQINKRLKDMKMRKTITAADIHYERVRFEEGYDRHVDKCKDQVDAIIKVQGLSRVEKYIVKRSTGDMKEAQGGIKIGNFQNVTQSDFNPSLNLSRGYFDENYA